MSDSIFKSSGKENRDVNGINKHIQIGFTDVLGEPHSIRSISHVWVFSKHCYICWRDVFYILCTGFCGLIISACWGCQFAFLTFQHVWVLSPCAKCFDLTCLMFTRLLTPICRCFIFPLTDACGYFFIVFSNSGKTTDYSVRRTYTTDNRTKIKQIQVQSSESIRQNGFNNAVFIEQADTTNRLSTNVDVYENEKVKYNKHPEDSYRSDHFSLNGAQDDRFQKVHFSTNRQKCVSIGQSVKTDDTMTYSTDRHYPVYSTSRNSSISYETDRNTPITYLTDRSNSRSYPANKSEPKSTDRNNPLPYSTNQNTSLSHLIDESNPKSFSSDQSNHNTFRNYPVTGQSVPVRLLKDRQKIKTDYSSMQKQRNGPQQLGRSSMQSSIATGDFVKSRRNIEKQTVYSSFPSRYGKSIVDNQAARLTWRRYENHEIFNSIKTRNRENILSKTFENPPRWKY